MDRECASVDDVLKSDWSHKREFEILSAWMPGIRTHNFSKDTKVQAKPNLFSLFKFSLVPPTIPLHNNLEKNRFVVLSSIVLLQYHLGFYFPSRYEPALPSAFLPALPLIYLCCDIPKTPRPGGGGDVAEPPSSSPHPSPPQSTSVTPWGPIPHLWFLRLSLSCFQLWLTKIQKSSSYLLLSS